MILVITVKRIVYQINIFSYTKKDLWKHLSVNSKNISCFYETILCIFLQVIMETPLTPPFFSPIVWSSKSNLGVAFWLPIVLFSGRPYQISTSVVSAHGTFKTQMIIKIDHFPSFVRSKGTYATERFYVHGTKWYILFDLVNRQSDNAYVCADKLVGRAEFLAGFVYARLDGGKQCLFDVEATFKFKHPSTAPERRFSHKYNLAETSVSYYGFGIRSFGRVEVSTSSFQ